LEAGLSSFLSPDWPGLPGVAPPRENRPTRFFVQNDQELKRKFRKKSESSRSSAIASTLHQHQLIISSSASSAGRGLNSWAVIYSTLTTPPSSNLQFISRQNKSCEPAEYQSLSNQNLHPTHRVVSPIDHSTTEASPPNPSSPTTTTTTTTTCLCPRPAALTT